MSNYYAITKHPKIGKWVKALWLDDHFGKHHYGVEFPDGKVFNPDKVELKTKKDNAATRFNAMRKKVKSVTKCDKPLRRLVEVTDLPMGVDEWMAHGRKYGYADYFKKDSLEEMLIECTKLDWAIKVGEVDRIWYATSWDTSLGTPTSYSGKTPTEAVKKLLKALKK